MGENADQILPVIFSIEGPELTDNEKALFKQANPLGFILFTRNCETPEQVLALTQSLQEVVERKCPVLIDQEGGRVQRLKPPIWRGYPAARTFGVKAEHDLEGALSDIRFRTMQISEELRESGINVNCDPCLDVLQPDTHEVIGDRAYSNDPDIVGRLSLAICRHYLSSGITPVIKHLPGHGRARADSHKELPRVDARAEELEIDFKPFQILAESDVADAIWAMPTPVLYPTLDPDHAACASPKIIQEIIRGKIGFQGILLSDALDMEGFAAYGDAAGRVNAVLDAGCDLACHCTGKFDEMKKIAESVPNLSSEAQKRLQKAADSRTLAA
ncbi:MAG: beta-N-acetylhexosaminidase [Pseudomonadota bacterium]